MNRPVLRPTNDPDPIPVVLYLRDSTTGPHTLTWDGARWVSPSPPTEANP
jgi:hypothetical protein